MEMFHLRSSSADRFLSCPGSRTLIAVARPQYRDNHESWEGQWCHWRIGEALVANHGAEAPNGNSYPEIPKDFSQPQSEWMIQYCLDDVLENSDTSMALVVEEAFGMDFSRFRLTGHIDCYAISADGSEAVIFDYKTNFNVVDDAVSNWQILCYIILLKHAFPTLKKVTARILQPRKSFEAGFRSTDVCLDGERLEKAAQFLADQVGAALDNPNTIDTGSHCRWCPIRNDCPGIKEEIIQMKSTLTPEAVSAFKSGHDLETMSELFIAHRYLNPVMESICDQLVDEVSKLPSGFVTKGGAKIFVKEVNGPRHIPAEMMETAWDCMCEALPSEFLFPATKFSFEQLARGFAKHLDIPIDSKVPGKPCGKIKIDQTIGGLIKQEKVKRLMIG